MQKLRTIVPCLVTGLLCLSGLSTAQTPADDPLTRGTRTDEHPVKYAIYSAAWALDTNAGLRIVANNRGDETVTLESVVFRDNTGSGDDTRLVLDLTVPAQGWAQQKTEYVDLLSGNSCVISTLEQDWQLKEISNYTLNPSVRGLIIEDTRSFRIFQCVREVLLTWTDSEQVRHQDEQWVMYHFERIALD